MYSSVLIEAVRAGCEHAKCRTFVSVFGKEILEVLCMNEFDVSARQVFGAFPYMKRIMEAVHNRVNLSRTQLAQV